MAFILALVDLRGRIERAGKNPRDYTAVFHTDSQLLVGQFLQLTVVALVAPDMWGRLIIAQLTPVKRNRQFPSCHPCCRAGRSAVSGKGRSLRRLVQKRVGDLQKCQQLLIHAQHVGMNRHTCFTEPLYQPTGLE